MRNTLCPILLSAVAAVGCAVPKTRHGKTRPDRSYCLFASESRWPKDGRSGRWRTCFPW